MAYLERVEQDPVTLTLNHDYNKSFVDSHGPYDPRKLPICPVDPTNVSTHDSRLVHVKIFDILFKKGPLSKNHLKKYFYELGNTFDTILNREVKTGTIKMYEENGKDMYVLTEKGNELRMFNKDFESIKEE
jgi:predicted transcriptional regulator